ncbi:MAG: glycosyltransferase [Sphingobacteriales bacterium]|nr:MAG: glycosyltransferase [Sphingobacteriales bacterium]
MKIAVLIPALNEADNIGKVMADIPQHLNDLIVVVDNGSSDGTAQIALQSGAAIVLHQPQRGYGSACLKGMAYLICNFVFS